MLTEVFYWLLNMSITGTIAALAVILIRSLSRIPRRVIFVLWLIPLFRLWVPVLLVSKFSLISLFMLPSSKVVSLPGQEVSAFQMLNMSGAATSYFPITFHMELLENIFLIASIVWFVVAIAIIAYLVGVYITGIRIARKAKPLGDRAYLSSQVTSPAVYGILRPRILVPASHRNRDLTWVRRHEEAHIRRLDNLWRLVALVTAAVHWFNPFVWLLLKVFFRDLEQACDESVLRTCSAEEKREYASALLDQYESRSIVASAFGGGELYARIEKILTYRNISVASAVYVIILSAALIYVLLTNPA